MYTNQINPQGDLIKGNIVALFSLPLNQCNLPGVDQMKVQ
jgi:hypothetical protein